MTVDLSLQPKQHRVLDLIQHSKAKVIGVGGGRGAAKSGGADRIALDLMMEEPGIVCCIVMRNWDQVRKYHVEPMLRQFPDLDEYYGRSDHNLILPVGKGVFSQLDFSYAESLPDVERRFRSGNYRYIIVDQAEQFSEQELGEMMLANRGRGNAKTVLLFNMGGIGIQALRKWFYTKEYSEHDRAERYEFVHVYPWDNVEWARDALAEDGLSPKHYYSWTDEERFQYFITRTDYGIKLNRAAAGAEEPRLAGLVGVVGRSLFRPVLRSAGDDDLSSTGWADHQDVG